MAEVKNFPVLKDENECEFCGACISVCSKNAIKIKHDIYNCLPQVDSIHCVKCGLCEAVCKTLPTIKNHYKKAYVALNKDETMRLNSASGGVFSALATAVLNSGGSVYGAALHFEDGRAVLEHIKLDKLKNLYKILGSKYIQSDSINALISVKNDLIQGKTVLFSGCSCQIAGLKKYLKDIDQTNLFTLDLICHGTPTIEFFNKYISWLNKKYRSKVKDFSFRTKRDGKIIYEIKVLFENDKEITIPYRSSAYYRMFMCGESYKNFCYKCKYASLEKPADITTGDYFEILNDYPDFFEGKNAIDKTKGISCVITHTKKGEELLEFAESFLYVKEVDPLVVQKSHMNLYKPSENTVLRYVFKYLHKIFGYSSLELFYKIRNCLVDLIKH